MMIAPLAYPAESEVKGKAISGLLDVTAKLMWRARQPFLARGGRPWRESAG